MYSGFYVRAVLAVLLVWSPSLPVFGAEAARSIGERSRPTPLVARFYAERDRIEQESKDIFNQTMRDLVMIDELQTAKPMLDRALARLDGLRDQLLQTARVYEGHFEPMSLTASLEKIRGRQANLVSYSIGRFQQQEVRKFLGEERVDDILTPIVSQAPPEQRKPTLFVLKPFRAQVPGSNQAVIATPQPKN